ncbi:MAG: hypothetical protein IJY31_02600 [Muribaculaceae bacterium]|nr:hypothetical protein [Muribaculaceae bacterium]
MKKISFALAALISIAIASIASDNSSYVCGNFGNILSFDDNDIDSITLSKVDINGVEHKGYVTQIIHAKDSTYVAEISTIDSISFVAQPQVTGDENISLNQEVDLGLSVNWAGWDIGASSPEETGALFRWAEIEEQENPKIEDYFLYIAESASKPWKYDYADLRYNISGTQWDVARKQWGGSWRMPTRKEAEELADKCTWEMLSYNNVKGFKITGPNGNSIFMPMTYMESDTTMYAYRFTGTDAQTDRQSMGVYTSNGRAYVIEGSYGKSDYYEYNYAGGNAMTYPCTARLPVRAVKGGEPEKLALLPELTFNAQQIVYDNAEYNIYLSQCLTTTDSLQTGSYPYKNGWDLMSINRHPQWRRHYVDLGVKANYVIREARKLNSLNYELIARTLRLLSTQLTTDAFGDMPDNEFYNYYHDLMRPRLYAGEAPLPDYVGQTEIYKWMFVELDEILDMYEDASVTGNPDNLAITAAEDYIYAGNLTAWKGLAYAIKARLLLRNIPNVDTSSAKCQEIIDCAQKAIDAWKSASMFEDPWFGCEPRFYFSGGIYRLDYAAPDCSPWSPAQPIINSWESRGNLLTSAVPSKFFIEDCLGVVNPGVAATKMGDLGGAGVYQSYNGYGTDPRLALLLIPNYGPVSSSDASRTDHLAIRYLENNIGTSSNVKLAHYPDLYAGAYAQNDGYNPLFTMEELYFIQAEAHYWMGNKGKAMELAREATEYNIKRHLTRFLDDNGGLYPGVGNRTSSLSVVQQNDQRRWERMVRAFLYNMDNGDTEYTQGTWLGTKRGNTIPVTEIGNKHWFFNAEGYSLYDLMTQKYIAMYMQPEQWTDMRRYHFSNNRNGYGIGADKEIVYPALRRPYNLYSPHWVDGLTDTEQENTWIQRLNYDPQISGQYDKDELERIGALDNPEWLKKPMIWAEPAGSRASLTE